MVFKLENVGQRRDDRSSSLNRKLLGLVIDNRLPYRQHAVATAETPNRK